MALDASVLYTLATKGTQDTDTGDRAQYSLAASGRVARRWDLALELNGEWTNQQEIGDTREDDSGGNQIFVGVATGDSVLNAEGELSIPLDIRPVP